MQRAAEYLQLSVIAGLGFAVAAQHVNQLMLDHVLDGDTGGLQILTRIEMIRMLVEVLTDAGGHREAQVGVNVDLADSAAGSLTQLLLGNADRIGHFAAVLVDDLYEFLRHGGRAMQHDRESRQTFGDFVKDVEAQRRGTRMPFSLRVHCSALNL